MSTAPIPDRGRRVLPGPTDEAPHVPVTDMARALGFYLALGCDVVRAADGWVLLHRRDGTGDVSFVLVHAVAGPNWRARHDRPAGDSSSTIRLSTSGLEALHQRLRAVGVPATAITYPAHAPAGEITIIDPDRHVVVVRQSVR